MKVTIFQEQNMVEHTFDAPAHFFKGKWRVDDIPVDRLYGEAVVIDISDKSLNNADYQMTKEDLLNWEKKHGQIPDKSIVMVFNDWGKRWPDKLTYLGTNSSDINLLHFPGVHEDAAKWLVSNRDIYGIGIDTPSIDYGQSKKFVSHTVFGEKNIYILENVANMDQLPPRGTMVYALPMKITGGSGGPTRIIAFKDQVTLCSGSMAQTHALLVVMTVLYTLFYLA